MKFDTILTLCVIASILIHCTNIGSCEELVDSDTTRAFDMDSESIIIADELSLEESLAHANDVNEVVSKEDIKVIVYMHNFFRANVSQPPAAEMQKLYWDRDLAVMAQLHADNCSFEHSLNNTGQNIIMITGVRLYQWKEALYHLFNGEQRMFKYGVGLTSTRTISGIKNAYHYTQIIKDDISRLGCGVSSCLVNRSEKKLFVCNYNKLQVQDGDNINNSGVIKMPYTAGTVSAELCPNKQDEEFPTLCDCHGIKCYNGGKLNVDTCTCTCATVWTGAFCGTKVKTTKDPVTGCVSPFWFNKRQELVYGCTTHDNIQNGTALWCSLDEEFVGKWAYCPVATTTTTTEDTITLASNRKRFVASAYGKKVIAKRSSIDE